MKRSIAIILAFIGGTALGSVSSYLYLNRKYRAILEEELHNAKEYYDRKLEETCDECIVQDLDIDDSVSIDYCPEATDESNVMTRTILAERQYPEDDEPELDEEDDQMDIEDQIENQELKNEEAGYSVTEEIRAAAAPKIIKAEEFGTHDGFETEVLLYFTEDEVLCEEFSQDEVTDPELMVGDCLDKFGFRFNDETTIYVRNSRLGTDYQIDKRVGSYSDWVDLG